MMKEIKNMKIHHYEIDVEDILKEILVVNDYVWSKNGIPLINNIQSIREVVRRDEYLMRRDMWKRDSNGDVRNVWKCTAVEHECAINREKKIKK